MSDADDKDDKGSKDDDKGSKGGGTTTKDEIREVVSEVLGGLFKSGRADVHDDDDDDDRSSSRRRRTGRGRGVDVDDIGRQVEDAVAKVNARTAAEKKEAEREARIAALEERTAKPEKQPREYRRATRLMGWVSDDDD